MKIAAITPEPPFPPDQGGRIRMYNLLKRLAVNHEVHLLSVSNGKISPETVSVLNQIFKTVSVFEFVHSWIYFVGSMLKSLIFQKPYILYKSTASGLKLFLANKIDEISPDILLIDFHYLLEGLPDTKIPKIVVLHNLDHILYSRFASGSWLSAKKIHGYLQMPISRKLEKRLPFLFDHCVAVSHLEKRILANLSGAENISVIPNGVDIEYFRPVEIADSNVDKINSDLIYFGSMDYYPNIDAIIFLVENILPIAWNYNKDITINIIGRNPPGKLMAYAKDPRIRIFGGVDDIRPYVAAAKVVVVPLRMGGGTRIKVLEAAAMGKAIIGTSIGVEGLDMFDKEQLLIADTPQDFAEQIILCLDSEIIRNEIGERARKYVKAFHDWNQLSIKLDDLIKNVMINHYGDEC